MVTHIVHYALLDSEFDTASDDMLLWCGADPPLCQWANRFPAWATKIAPVDAEPRVAISSAMVANAVEQLGRVAAITREETFELPTIERERLHDSPFSNRVPALNTAFRLG